MEALSQTMKEGFARVDRRFERVEGEMKEGFERVDRRFERIDDKLDKLFYIQLFFFVSLAIAVISHAVSV